MAANDQTNNASSQNSLGTKFGSSGGRTNELRSTLRRIRTPKQPAENSSKHCEFVPKHLIASDPRASKLVQDVVLRMTLNSAQDFLCTAKSSLMSIAGQNRIFHHLLLPIRGSSPVDKAQSPRMAPIDNSSPRVLPDALTVLAMASRKRRMHLARSPRSTLEARSPAPHCRAMPTVDNMRMMRTMTASSLSSAELSACSGWD